MPPTRLSSIKRMPPLKGKLKYASRADARFLYREVFEERCYLQHGVELPAEGARVIDVGANNGMFSLLAMVEGGAHSGKVVAIEPSRRAAAALRHNVRVFEKEISETGEDGSDGMGSIEVIEAACGNGTMDQTVLTVYPFVSGWSTTHKNEAEVRQAMQAYVGNLFDPKVKGKKFFGPAFLMRFIPPVVADFITRQLVNVWLWRKEEQSIRIVSVSEAAREGGLDVGPIHLLKIDCERAEVEVLEGIDEEDWDRIEQVVVEVHSENLARVTEILRERKYHIVTHEDGLFRGTGILLLFCKQLK